MPKLRNAVYLLVATSSVAIAGYQPQEISAPTSLADLAPHVVAPAGKAVTAKTWHEAQVRAGVKLE